jgi:hypothetical protein
MSVVPEVSHGRGGAGNINPDDTKYIDGEIVRQGAEGTHGDGVYSTGRGGKSVFLCVSASLPLSSSLKFYSCKLIRSTSRRKKTGAANIADKETPSAMRADTDFVPAEATRTSIEVDFHTGRGGAANVQRVSESENSKGGTTGAAVAHHKNPNQGLADKLKHKIFGAFKK